MGSKLLFFGATLPMTDSLSNRTRTLRGDAARDLQSRAEKLGHRVEKGVYDDSDLSDLRYILKNVRDYLVGNDARLSEVIGISSKTIASTYNGGSRPKYNNFMKMLYGAKKILSAEIASPGSQNVNLGHPQNQDLLDDKRIRIRSNRSNIFLSEADLKLVQEIARQNNTEISNVMSQALRGFASGTASRPDSTDLSGHSLARRELARNRVEIIRYSTAIIDALQEALDYDPQRHHNAPPPSLRIDDTEYLAQLQTIITELKRLNSLLEQVNTQAAEKLVHRISKHFDTFFGSYAKAMGSGVAGLTIATALALLYRAGVAKELIDAIWQHWRPE
jgi:hypothetical protein